MSHIFLSRLPEPGKYGFADKDDDGIPYDLLGRVEAGKNSSALIERISDPLVIALNGDWGSGKSHFLRLWAGAHGKENGGTAQVIYFDAFENDFLDDPLTSLVAAIRPPPTEQTVRAIAYEKVKQAAAMLALPTVRVGLAAVTAGASEVVGAVGGAVLGAVSTETEALADAYWVADKSRRAAMDEFRVALRALTTDTDGTPRKLVFIVDELDRCRPDYALSLLETIKHFFAIKNVHFILGTNLTALESAVRVRYGADCDAGRYLQKFVHLTMTLPDRRWPAQDNTTALAYFDSLSERSGLPSNVADALELHIKQLAMARGVSLRDIERLVGYAALYHQWDRRQSNYLHLLLMALILRCLKPELYKQLCSKRLSTGDLLDFYGLAVTAAEDENGLWLWSRRFWGAAFDGKGSDEEFKAQLSDYWGGDRKGYVERYLANNLDTFQFADEG